MDFPVFIPLGPWRLHPHFFFETLAYLVGFRLCLIARRRRGDALDDQARWSVIVAAAAGGTIGSKLLASLEDPAATLQHLNDPAFLFAGKSIVGALVGGLMAVEWTKRWIGVSKSSGDLFAIPLAAGIAIGRIGCFLTGVADRTYGTATDLPWGVDMGDGVRRHPTQLYEIAFLVTLAIVLRTLSRSGRREGDLFRMFMVAYMGFRLLVDAIKPDVRIALGLTSIQWACVAILVYYASDMRRWIAADAGARPLAGAGRQEPGAEDRVRPRT